MKYKGIEIQIIFEKEESTKHLEADFNVVLEKGLDNIIKENLIPMLIETDCTDKELKKILKGIKLFDIYYCYSKIIAEYSPTKEEEYFGQIKFCFESCNKYTKNLFEAVEIEIYILDGQIVKIIGYDI